MSDNSEKRPFDELMAEYQELMKRQLELQKELFGSQMAMMGQLKQPLEDALKAFMGSWASVAKEAVKTPQEAKPEPSTESNKDKTSDFDVN